ncbi:hypothetical protein EOM39_01460 [Candidatus Gracilibacteria bacterium]|nr:hypothetical protein [Candidatus Gracilibacteria bacterium]
MYTFLIIFIILLLSLFIYYFYLLNLNKKINKIEINIQKLLQNRADTIPGLYEISKEYLIKHSKVFEEAIKLRKLQFSLNEYSVSFIEFIKNEIAINHEFSFIFSICTKNKKLSEIKKFKYIKKLIIEKNQKIGIEIENYKKTISLLNNLIIIKNYTVLGFALPLGKRIESDLIKNIF